MKGKEKEENRRKREENALEGCVNEENGEKSEISLKKGSEVREKKRVKRLKEGRRYDKIKKQQKSGVSKGGNENHAATGKANNHNRR